MRKHLKTKIRMTTLALTAAILLALLPEASVSAAGIAVNSTNFPDATFRKYVSQRIDADGNGSLSAKEIKDVIDLAVPSKGIKDLTGIQYFTQITYLDCSNNELKSLNVSKNIKLTTIECEGNKITSLDLSKNTKLSSISCGWNKLKKLDLSKNPEIRTVNCSDNQLTAIDLSKSINLENINCSDNQLPALNTGACTTLFTLYCPNNKLTKLDVSKNTKLHALGCTNNQLTELVISNNPNLVTLNCDENKLTKLDLGSCKILESLKCNDNALTKLDLSKNSKLESLNIRKNKIKTIDLSANTNLKFLESGPLDVLDISNCRNLIDVTLEYQEFPKALKVCCGQKTALRYYIPPYSDAGTWTNSKNDILTMDNSNLTAKKAGKTVLTGKAGDKDAKIEVQVLFKDVISAKDFWYEPVYYLHSKGVVKGYDNETKFNPSGECTRAQMMTFLWRLNGSPNPKSKTTGFTDIKSSDYFYKAVLWAVEKGITTGASKDKFDPSGVCTRAQTVTFLWRMANKPEPKSATCKFKDVNSSDYFYKATIWASEKKIVAGYSDNTFQPKGHCLRRQMVTFLYKYDKYINGKG